MPRGDKPTTVALALKDGWIYEDTLPASMTKEEYDWWFKESLVLDGVRMGPPLTQPPDRIWMRAEVLASPELRKHFVKLNSDDIEYALVSPASAAPVVESPILAFQAWLERWVVDNGRKLTQDEYGIAYAAFIAAHPGEGPKAQVCAAPVVDRDPSGAGNEIVSDEQVISEITKGCSNWHDIEHVIKPRLREMLNARFHAPTGKVSEGGENSAAFTAYNQAIEDAMAAIRGEKVDDPYAAPTFINAIARKCSPHVYVNGLAAASSADMKKAVCADNRTEEIRSRLNRFGQFTPTEDDIRYLLSRLDAEGETPEDNLGREQIVQAITDVQEARESHVQWANHLRNEKHALCAGCDEFAAHIGNAEYHDEWDAKYDNVIAVLARFPFSAAATPAPMEHNSIPLTGYERILTIEWDKYNARRHELIKAERSRVLSENEVLELFELQWLAGVKRELAKGPPRCRACGTVG